LGLGNAGLFLAIFISGFFILFLGEIFPKTFAIYLAEKISLTCAQLLDLFSWLFLPFIFIIEKIVAFFSLFLQWFPRKSLLSFDELKTAILVSRKEGQISEEEKGMISSVLEFKDTWVSEIMSHRVDMHAIDTLEPQQDVNKILQQKKHSKFPVYEGSSDNIIGILYAKDFFLDSGIDYHLLLKAPLFIPETKKIGELLKLFLEKKERIAIVLDEHGGTAGLVTLEDIEEEIFGEIYDEFETPKEFIEKINEKSYRLYAKTPVKALNLALNLNIPQEQNTIAGFILSQLGKIPHAEEILPFGNLEFFIERASTKRIISVILHIK
jgi:putative hemolysin